MNHPNELEWIEGGLPDVHSVPYNCCALVWTVYDNPTGSEKVEGGGYRPVKRPGLTGKFKGIRMPHPRKDNLNPLKWNNYVGFEEKVKYYAWLYKGDKE